MSQFYTTYSSESSSENFGSMPDPPAQVCCSVAPRVSAPAIFPASSGTAAAVNTSASVAVEHVRELVRLAKNDRVTFNAIIQCDQYNGKCGFAMIANASALLDVSAWMQFQRIQGGEKLTNKELFRMLFANFTAESSQAFHDSALLYTVVRCGVVHQAFPKGLAIIADDQFRPNVYFNKSGCIAVSCYAFYDESVKVLEHTLNKMEGASPADKAVFDQRLEERTQKDSDELASTGVDAQGFSAI